MRRLRARFLGRAFVAHRVDGRSMGVAVDAWRAAGGFDETLYSSEDAVFGYAVQEHAGRAALSLDSTVIWEQADTLREMATMYGKYGEWGGRAGSAPLVARDLVRTGALAALPTLALCPGRPRRLAAVAAAAYVGMPLARAVTRGAPPSVVLAAPAVLVVKDVAKARGFLIGLARRFSP